MSTNDCLMITVSEDITYFDSTSNTNYFFVIECWMDLKL